MKENMFRLSTLLLFVLVSCSAFLHGMVPNAPGGTEGGPFIEFFTGRMFVVPTIEGTVMTTIAVLPAAVKHMPFKEALIFSLTEGGRTALVGAMAIFIPIFLVAGTKGILPSAFPPTRPFFEWKNKRNIALAVALSCMTLLGKRDKPAW